MKEVRVPDDMTRFILARETVHENAARFLDLPQSAQTHVSQPELFVVPYQHYPLLLRITRF